MSPAVPSAFEFSIVSNLSHCRGVDMTKSRKGRKKEEGVFVSLVLRPLERAVTKSNRPKATNNALITDVLPSS